VVKSDGKSDAVVAKKIWRKNKTRLHLFLTEFIMH
jgi:hypothetical protein